MIQASLRKAGLLATLTLAALCSQAQTVTVGLAADITSADPHYHLVWSNMNVSEHVFNRLIERNDQARMLPGLALSWRALDDTTWEFKLRPNVTFHDGSPFTADDVVFSIERVASIKDSPGSFTIYTKAITGMTVVDPLTVRFKTAAAHPLLPAEMTSIAIVSKKAASGATTADFNSGKAAIGTGPYKLVRYARGDRIEMTRNDAYWGKKPQVQNLVFKILPNDAARVAALLSNDVQIIEALPVADLKRLTGNADVSVIQRASSRVIYLNVDSGRDQSPFVTDKDGKPLAANPLKDVRVRKALSKAIDRDLIRSRVMEGASRPTAQLMIPGLSGYSEALKAEPVDIEGAKKLLADAGYPNGFSLTLHGPNNRYVQDDQILQTVAQMLSRVGITAKVDAQPAAMFFPKQNKGEYSLSLTGWGSGTFEASSPLRALIATPDKDKGLGTFNSGRYSNAKVDELIDKATRTINDAEREALLQQATEAAMADQALIPLHHQVNLWAARKPLSYGGRADERTYGFDFVLQQP
jgi:peptide/nickel transport system substrate-binding protein